jgi:predicted nucleotidyltransferase
MRSLPDHVQTTIHRIEAGLRALYGARFRGLLLYGSYARGEADEGSDVDLLLLLEGPVDAVKEILRLQPIKSPISLEADLALSVIPASIEDYEKRATRFLLNIGAEAVAAA